MKYTFLVPAYKGRYLNEMLLSIQRQTYTKFKVIISDDAIAFKVKDREDRYLWKDIRDFRVKEFIDRKQVYIRINKQNPSLFKGRYWVYCRYFNDADELFMFFIKKEMEIHPDTIKAYARRGSKPAEKK